MAIRVCCTGCKVNQAVEFIHNSIWMLKCKVQIQQARLHKYHEISQTTYSLHDANAKVIGKLNRGSYCSIHLDGHTKLQPWAEYMMLGKRERERERESYRGAGEGIRRS